MTRATATLAIVLGAAGCGEAPDTAVHVVAAAPGPRVPAVRRRPSRAASSAPVVQLAAVGGHACARHADGAVSCWGQNAFGEVGDPGAAQMPDLPQDRSVVASPIGAPVAEALEVATGGSRTCVRRADGVWCWGAGSFDGEHIAGTAGAVEITDGCARYADGLVRCWNDLVSADLEPELIDVIDLAADRGRTCALRRGGRVRCWMAPNEKGEIPAIPDSDQAVDGAIEVATGVDMACVRTEAGEVRCWLDNRSRYERVDVEDVQPVRIDGLDRVLQIAVGYGFACARDADRAVKCWGNRTGQRYPAFLAETVPGIVADEIAAGDGFVCARDGGAVRCWGDNQRGELGIGWSAVHPAPIEVPGIEDAVEVHAGLTSSCARLRSGAVRCWGQVDDVTYQMSPIAVEVSPAGKGAAGMTGSSELCIRFTNGDVRCGVPDALRHRRAQHALDVSCASSHCASVLPDGTLWSWGKNTWRMLGDGTLDDRPYGVVAEEIADAVTVGTSTNATCFVRRDGTVACLGRELSSTGNLHAHAEPVEGIDRATAVVLGETHGCALISDGTVRCWGRGPHGQLGRDVVANPDQTPGTQPIARPVPGVDHVVQIAGSSGTACARRSDGTVMCWGTNLTGILGDPTALAWSSVPIPLGLTGVVDLSVGDHACAVLATGRVACWGAASVGQLGTLAAGHLEPADARAIVFGP